MAAEYNLLRFDPTTGAIQYFEGSSWYSPTFGNFSAGTITASLTGHASLDLPLTGGTLTGSVAFSGTTTSFRLPNLTSTERDALTAAKGMMIYNTSTDAVNYYDGGWKVVAVV